MNIKRFIPVLFISAFLPCLFSCNKEQEQSVDNAEISFTTDSIFVAKGQNIEFRLQGDKELSLITFTFDNEIIIYDGITLTGLEEGSTTIVAKYNETSCSCLVYVNLTDIDLSISTKEITIDPGETSKISVVKDNKDYPYVYWMSENESIAEVNDDGIVTGVNAGVTTITAYVHGDTYQCKVNVFGVDDHIDDWFINKNPIYGRGWGQRDFDNPERRYVAWARLKEEGVYLAGYAYHKTYTDNLTYWWGNTNFEVKMLIDSTMMTYYASENIVCPDAISYMKTTLNEDSTTDYDKYYSQFEIFIPYIHNSQYVRLSFAFKTEGEKMRFIVGGNNPVYTTDDWWWIDLHHPTNTAEYFYLYEDGLYEEAKA